MAHALNRHADLVNRNRSGDRLGMAGEYMNRVPIVVDTQANGVVDRSSGRANTVTIATHIRSRATVDKKMLGDTLNRIIIHK